MRAVLDTNILISAVIRRSSIPGRILDLWRTDQFELVTSSGQVGELTTVVLRPKFRRFFSDRAAATLLDEVLSLATFVYQLPMVDLSPDPDDNRILAIAIAGEADYLVSGDKRDLLSLTETGGIEIVTAREFVNRLDAN